MRHDIAIFIHMYINSSQRYIIIVQICHYDAHEHVASMCMHVLGDKAMHVQTI